MSENFAQQEFRKNFSQRNGFIPIPPALNLEGITDQLRLEFEDLFLREQQEGNWKRSIEYEADWERILGDIWVQIFKRSRFPGVQDLCIQECRRIIRVGDFHEVFTIMEELAFRIENKQPSFQKEINAALVRNQAPYILQNSPTLGWGMMQTGTYEEGKAVLIAFRDLQSENLTIPKDHFEKAGRHLAKDKEECAAVRESIMGLEALLKIFADKPKVSLGSILETEREKLEIPLPLNDSFKGMWKYRSEAPGVAHSDKQIPSCPPPSRWEAQLMYVFCCAAASYFINKRRTDKQP
jgi:hypothetical protein